MKQVLFGSLLALSLCSCGNATDGDARTSTAPMIQDTGAMSAVNETASHINTNLGVYPRDTMTQQRKKSDVRSSSASPARSRATTPGNDGVKQ